MTTFHPTFSPLSLFIYIFATKFVKSGNTPPFIRKTKTVRHTRCRGKTMWHQIHTYNNE